MRGRAARARDAMEPSTATLENLTPVRKRLQVEVPADGVQGELDRTFHEVGQRARLRGFRPGKAPRPVLERVFGEEVRREVLGRLVEASFHHAVETHGLAVVGTPDIDAEPITPGAALRYSATVEVRPAIALGDLSGLQIARPTTRVSDEDVERTIGELRESVAQLRPVEDRAQVEAGDVVRVDLTSRLEGGEPVHREGVLLAAGPGSVPLALERQRGGQRRGARRPPRVPDPGQHRTPGVAGTHAGRGGCGVSDAVLAAEIGGLAARGGQVVERVRALYGRAEARGALRAKLVRDRALARLLGTARVMPSLPAESVAHEK